MTPASMAMTLPHGADRLDTMQVTLRVEVERDLPERKAATHQAEKVHLDPTSDLYHRAYQSWRVGELDDKGVVNIFGDEWLFLFQVNKEGLEGETLDRRRHPEASGTCRGRGHTAGQRPCWPGLDD